MARYHAWVHADGWILTATLALWQPLAFFVSQMSHHLSLPHILGSWRGPQGRDEGSPLCPFCS